MSQSAVGLIQLPDIWTVVLRHWTLTSLMHPSPCSPLFWYDEWGKGEEDTPLYVTLTLPAFAAHPPLSSRQISRIFSSTSLHSHLPDIYALDWFGWLGTTFWYTPHSSVSDLISCSADLSSASCQSLNLTDIILLFFILLFIPVMNWDCQQCWQISPRVKRNLCWVSCKQYFSNQYFPTLSCIVTSSISFCPVLASIWQYWDQQQQYWPVLLSANLLHLLV